MLNYSGMNVEPPTTRILIEHQSQRPCYANRFRRRATNFVGRSESEIPKPAVTDYCRALSGLRRISE
jgi:hypothetical protein